MSTSVASMYDHISDSNSYIMLEDSDEYMMPMRAKKRRLDHLSWEEKLQRKKLKNRVAAQTSRDRKKAKMEQMESTVNDLMVQNETILSELEKLKRTNEKLVKENEELARKWVYRIPPSAARTEQTLSSDFECANSAGPLEDCDGLPSLPDLLDEINRDVDLSSLEELTQTLLQDIARDLEAAAHKADTKESDGVCGFAEMVGQASEQLEPSGSDCVKVEPDNELSEFLLLHHDYLKDTRKASSKSKRKKLKTIKPKVEVKSEPLDEEPTVFTLVVNDCDLGIEEVVARVVQCDSITNDHIYSQPLRPPSPRDDGSNFNSDASDCGYESFGSPSSVDLCVSELFPSLI